MNFFNQLSNFFMMPVDQIKLWFQELSYELGLAWDSFLTNAALGVTEFMVEGVAICVICYSVYCAYRVICSSKDETFSEYINKSMIAGLCYFFARCGGNIILKAIGGV